MYACNFTQVFRSIALYYKEKMCKYQSSINHTHFLNLLAKNVRMYIQHKHLILFGKSHTQKIVMNLLNVLLMLRICEVKLSIYFLTLRLSKYFRF